MAAKLPLHYTKEMFDACRCQDSLRDYVRIAWPHIEPQPFVPNWHIDAVCDHLEAVLQGHIRNLVINIPPRHSKSLVTCVMWPSWTWGPKNLPHIRWLTSSYAQSLSIRDSVKCRRLIQSPWYQKFWGSRFRLMGDQNAKERYDTDKGGYRLATSVGGSNTGEGGDIIIIDDPHNVQDVESDAVRTSALEWLDGVMSTRANNPKSSAFVIIMQRSHFDDMTGHVLKQGGYELLSLPAEFEPETRCRTSIFVDPRTRPGELLNPARFGEEEIRVLKVKMGTYAYNAQMQQRPAPISGGIFKTSWWKYYDHIPEDLEFLYQTWDLTFKDTKGSARVSGQVWGQRGANFYLLDEVCEHLSFTKTVQAIRSMTEHWPRATAKYVEEKANGAAVIDYLKDEIPGIIAVNPDADKVSRAHAVTPLVEAGNVFLPNPAIRPWVKDFVEELSQFPLAFYKDRVDAFTQGIRETMKRRASREIPEIVSLTQNSIWSDAVAEYR
jgi:predicted phage terminase large subunit-like protein